MVEPAQSPRDGKRSGRYYARLRRMGRRRRGVEELNSDGMVVDRKITCDDDVEVNRSKFKNGRSTSSEEVEVLEETKTSAMKELNSDEVGLKRTNDDCSVVNGDKSKNKKPTDSEKMTTTTTTMKKRRKSKKKKKKKAMTDIENGEDEELPKFMLDDYQGEDCFVAADSVDAELLGVQTPDNLVFNKLLRMPRYFDQERSNWWFCYNCNEEGHVAANCNSERRKKPCFVCGMFGHDARKCSKGHNCSICKRRGHLTKDCSVNKNKIFPNSKVCLRCGNIGHDMSNCTDGYDPEDLKMIQCYVCQSFGHLCCVAIDTGPKIVSCYNCGQIGHSGDGCAKPRHQATTSIDLPTLCYKCGKEGHFARGCTNNNKLDRWSGEPSTPILQKFKKQHSSELSLSKSAPPREFARFRKKNNLYYDERSVIMSTAPRMKKKHGWIVDDHDDLPYDRYNSIGCPSSSSRLSPRTRSSSGSNGHSRNTRHFQYARQPNASRFHC